MRETYLKKNKENYENKRQAIQTNLENKRNELCMIEEKLN